MNIMIDCPNCGKNNYEVIWHKPLNELISGLHCEYCGSENIGVHIDQKQVRHYNVAQIVRAGYAVDK